MANLENLRKQAKQIIRWHRQGHFPVAQIVRSWLPRFATSNDAEIMQGELRLSEAQEIVARRAGFENWQALLKGESEMTEPSVSMNRASLTAAEPQLLVTEMAGAVEHYQELGFEVVFSYGEPAFYAQIRRDDVALNLRLVHAPFDLEGLREKESLLAATLLVDDVKALFLEFQAGGVEFHQSLKREPWASRTFIVKDPDGNLILFAGSGGA